MRRKATSTPTPERPRPRLGRPTGAIPDIIEIDGRQYGSSAFIAKLLGISERTLHRLAQAREGPPRVKVGRAISRYELSGVRAWLDSKTERPVPSRQGARARSR